MPGENKSVSQLAELQDENKRLRERLELLEKVIKQKTDYAWDLVWYARSDPQEPIGEMHRREVEEKYPKEVKNLESKDSNWHHGFNSGCLALRNLFMEILHAEDTVAGINEDIEKEHARIDFDSDDEDTEPQLLTVDEYIKQIIDEYPQLDT